MCMRTHGAPTFLATFLCSLHGFLTGAVTHLMRLAPPPPLAETDTLYPSTKVRGEDRMTCTWLCGDKGQCTTADPMRRHPPGPQGPAFCV